MKTWAFSLLFLVGAVLAVPATAHQASDSYLRLAFDDQSQLQVRWDIAIRDLQPVLAFDRDNNGLVTWQELQEQAPGLIEYAQSRLGLRTDRSCRLEHQSLQVVEHSDGGYVVLNMLGTECAASDNVEIGYSALFDIDTSHRGLVEFRHQQNQYTAVMSPNERWQSVGVAQGWWASFVQFVREGVWHVWIGFDHILFLLTLLLPCLIGRDAGVEQSAKYAIARILGVVTAFTVAHSVTLGLAVTGMVNLPAALVEISIALSVTVVAINNLVPIITKRHWLLAGIFGLIHGFGFAGAMSDLDLSGVSLVSALAGFNIGVELGQAAIVLVFVPLVWGLRNSWFYQVGMVRFGSVAVALVGMVWAVERFAAVA
ncbi:MAG: membrane protein [Lysobacteraceae bacterium]|nr:MAG: membrane protein [Xanthomonadaceae bacterium]